MFGERRTSERYTINRVAKFQTESGALPRECTISNISETGARLFIESIEPPDQFYLLISGTKPIREECRVVWRLGGEVGVTFVTKLQEKQRQELMNRLRAEAKQALSQGG